MTNPTTAKGLQPDDNLANCACGIKPDWRDRGTSLLTLPALQDRAFVGNFEARMPWPKIFMLLDLKNAKILNAIGGREDVNNTMAQLPRMAKRACAGTPDHELFRIGGDEFLLVQPHSAAGEKASNNFFILYKSARNYILAPTDNDRATAGRRLDELSPGLTDYLIPTGLSPQTIYNGEKIAAFRTALNLLQRMYEEEVKRPDEPFVLARFFKFLRKNTGADIEDLEALATFAAKQVLNEPGALPIAAPLLGISASAVVAPNAGTPEIIAQVIGQADYYILHAKLSAAGAINFIPFDPKRFMLRQAESEELAQTGHPAPRLSTIYDHPAGKHLKMSERKEFWPLIFDLPLGPLNEMGAARADQVINNLTKIAERSLGPVLFRSDGARLTFLLEEPVAPKAAQAVLETMRHILERSVFGDPTTWKHYKERMVANFAQSLGVDYPPRKTRLREVSMWPNPEAPASFVVSPEMSIGDIYQACLTLPR